MSIPMIGAPPRVRTSARALLGMSAPAAEPTPTPPAASTGTRRLGGNPLFVDGAAVDEFQVSAQNVDFAGRQFNLDADFVSLVKAAPANTRFSVIYHSEPTRVVQVDACRAAVGAGKDAVFSLYTIKNPDFDPSAVYQNELMTPLDGSHVFGTEVVSKRLVVPENADPAMKRWLGDNGFEPKETTKVADLGYPAGLKKYFGLPDTLGVQMFDPEKQSFAQKFKIFYQLMKESPEYRALKIGDMVGTVGSAMVLGVITPELWKEGTAYGIASTISSIGNIGQPAVSILGESLLGSVVDNAVNSDRPMAGLKKISLITATANSAVTGCNLALHPAILSKLGAHPGLAFVGLYGTATVIGAVSDVMAGKADMAIHDQLINKAGLKADYSKNFYQIMGVEGSVSQLLYLGAYSATVAAVTAFPAASLAIAAGGAALTAASNFIWPLYRERPEIKTTIEATAFVHEGDRYVFDSGWEVAFQGGKDSNARIVREDATHYLISMNDGELYVKSDNAPAVSVAHKRTWKDHLPKVMSPAILGEKEEWDLDNGTQKVDVARYGSAGYGLKQVSDHEFVVSRDRNSSPFWKS